MNAVALIDCNNFYVSCERLFQPSLNDRPVIVLSNNDGCVVSRSNEAKQMGIPMGVPLFQIKDEVARNNVEVYSSNYALYGDMSARVMDAISYFSNEVEFYSIDEAFATLEANRYSDSLLDNGIMIREAVKRWTGIPTSIGIGPTKTLAKIAARIAKKSEDGVYDLMDVGLRERVLAETDVIDIWGVNKAAAKKLNVLGVHTARELRDLDLRTARKSLTVVGSRLVEELRGNSSLPLEFVQPLKKSICCSRSFSAEVTSLGELTESVINHLSTAAEKLRRSRLVANALNLFIRTNQFKEQNFYSNSVTVKVGPTDSTRELIAHVLGLLRAVYRPGFGYRKSGVVLLDLQPAAGETRRLFDDEAYVRDRQLMRTVDMLNAKHGRRTLHFGAPYAKQRNWHMNRNHLSPAFTTDVSQVLRAVT
ncbi:MAG: Y-family DNA polymerase [Pyrinomonadaceae bacterium]